ncbi:hypothetical protein [Microbacterium sp. K24]|uniref:hypothetical protein n=1 Tax=Microbacterium sp. K24 TaxID=2305446 RepID=UPI00109C7BC5|nr:hypothetical protein [Microbacterium sp. K24]
MSTIVDGREFRSPEMAQAYQDAVQAVRAEQALPEEVQAARRRALLRWINNDKRISVVVDKPQVVRLNKA